MPRKVYFHSDFYSARFKAEQFIKASTINMCRQ